MNRWQIKHYKNNDIDYSFMFFLLFFIKDRQTPWVEIHCCWIGAQLAWDVIPEIVCFTLGMTQLNSWVQACLRFEDLEYSWWNLHITSNTEMLRKLFNGFHTVSFHVTLLINIYLVFLLLLPLSPFYFRPDELQMVTSTQPELEGRSGLGSQYTMRCSSITGMCQPVLNFLARLVFTMSLC